MLSVAASASWRCSIALCVVWTGRCAGSAHSLLRPSMECRLIEERYEGPPVGQAQIMSSICVDSGVGGLPGAWEKGVSGSFVLSAWCGQRSQRGLAI